MPKARSVKHSAIVYPICTVKNCCTPNAEKPSWETIKPQRERETEIPSEARIPTPSFCRGENLGLEKESGLLQVTLLAGGRAGTGAQPSGSQPSEPSAMSVPHREGRAAVARAGSPGIDHAWGGWAEAVRATRAAGCTCNSGLTHCWAHCCSGWFGAAASGPGRGLLALFTFSSFLQETPPNGLYV